MTYNSEGLILEKEIQQLTLECHDRDAQALALPPYYQAAE